MLRNSHDKYSEEIYKALDLVAQFIIKKDLIIYGGTSIDFSLKRLGKQGIYDDAIFTDYDVFSSDNVNDAYELANILHNAGLSTVSCIRAIHLQTMRVRVNFIVVADISYLTNEQMKKIPTLNYGKFRIVHPHYQLMDMHLSYSFPFNNPPMEDFLYRFTKNEKYFNLILDAYPIENVEQKFITVTREVKLDKNKIYNGFIAFQLLQLMIEGKKIPNIIECIFPSENDSIEIITNESAHKSSKIHCEYLDIIPKRYIYDMSISNSIVHPAVGAPTTLFITKNKLLSIYKYDGYTIPTTNYILLYFLYNFFILSNKNPIYLFYYRKLLTMKNDNSKTLTITTDVYGNENINAAQLIKKSYIMKDIGEHMELDFGIIPENYYPDGKKETPIFDYSKTKNFIKDGSICES